MAESIEDSLFTSATTDGKRLKGKPSNHQLLLMQAISIKEAAEIPQE